MDKVKKYLPLSAAIAGALALLLFVVCDAVVADLGWLGEMGVSGMDAMTDGKFVFMMFLTILLVLGAIACSILAFLKPENDLFAYIAAGCFIVAAIFCFSTKGFYLTANDMKEVADGFKLGFGPVIAGIFSILSAGAVATPVVLKKLGK